MSLARTLMEDLGEVSLHIRYQAKGGQVTDRKITPILLLNDPHFAPSYGDMICPPTHVLAWCHLRKDIRLFIIGSIQSADPCEYQRLSPAAIATAVANWIAKHKRRWWSFRPLPTPTFSETK